MANPLVKLFWRVHPKLYSWSGGRIGGNLMGLPVLLLTTKGRKSGLPRTKALMYLPYRDTFVVIASNLGSAYHPHWWLNLEADSNASVQIGRKSFSVTARAVEGQERGDIWGELTKIAPAYDEYKAKTPRNIPVVVLEKK